MFGKDFQRKYALSDQGYQSGRTLYKRIEAADKIVVLADGKVVEDGKPSDLYEREDGVFRHMVNLQYASVAWSL